MPATEADLRREIASERAQLAGAVASLRGELERAKRRAPAAAAGAVAAIVVLALVVRAVRRR